MFLCCLSPVSWLDLSGVFLCLSGERGNGGLPAREPAAGLAERPQSLFTCSAASAPGTVASVPATRWDKGTDVRLCLPRPQQVRPQAQALAWTEAAELRLVQGLLTRG